jgi:hypothetical protein
MQGLLLEEQHESLPDQSPLFKRHTHAVLHLDLFETNARGPWIAAPGLVDAQIESRADIRVCSSDLHSIRRPLAPLSLKPGVNGSTIGLYEV